MKILHIIDFLYRSAGTSVFVVEIARAMEAQGHQTLVLIRDEQENPYPTDGIEVQVFKDFDSLSTDWDVVHIHSLWKPWLTQVSKWAHRHQLPVVWSPHGTLTPWALKYKLLKKLVGMLCYQYWSLRQANLFHVTTEAEVSGVRRLGLRAPTSVVPLGVNLPANEKVVKNGKGVRNILFLSRIHPGKGLINLMDAWAEINKSQPELVKGWRITIAGADENHIDSILARAKEHGTQDSVTYVGPVFGEKKEALYDQADIFVLPTFSENFGSVVIEALSHATPVICTKGAPWSELESYKCGMWIDIGVEPLAKALARMMKLSDQERYAMGMAGRRLVEEKYTWESAARQMIRGYGEIVKSGE